MAQLTFEKIATRRRAKILAEGRVCVGHIDDRGNGYRINVVTLNRVGDPDAVGSIILDVNEAAILASQLLSSIFGQTLGIDVQEEARRTRPR